MTLTRAEVEARARELGPWFYEFDLGPHGRTVSALPENVRPIHATRLDMVNQVVDAHFAGRFGEIACLDVGCHEGYYAVAMARKGMRAVDGVDVREASLEKARFVSEALGLTNVSFARQNCEELQTAGGRQYELVLFLGLLYHLENPMLCLRNIARVTGEVCVVETQVVEEVDGYTEWGAREWTRPYHGVLALIDESGEFYSENAETGASPLATCPSPKALRFMLKQAGFRRVEMVTAPDGAYEQLARGKRVVCAAYK